MLEFHILNLYDETHFVVANPEGRLHIGHPIQLPFRLSRFDYSEDF